MAVSLVDANVVLRHLLQDHADHSPRASAYLQRVENAEIRVHLPLPVLFEIVFTLQRSYKVPRAEIRAQVLPLLQLPGVLLPGKRRLRSVFDLFVQHNVSFVDAYNAVLADDLRLEAIVSFDRGYDRIPGTKRAEP